MNIYARVRKIAGFNLVVEILSDYSNPDGTVIPIDQLYNPDFVSTLIDITSESPKPEPWWTATETGGIWSFSLPTSPLVLS